MIGKTRGNARPPGPYGINKGYYWVKFYNHEQKRVLYWNGGRFESFISDFVNDEIEYVGDKVK